MKIRCIANDGKYLRAYEPEVITSKNVFGRFGVSESVTFDVVPGAEYAVMGIVIFETYQAYLIDDNGVIATYPCQLFEIVDSQAGPDWHFRLIGQGEDIYPFVQALIGYPELISEPTAYQRLLM